MLLESDHLPGILSFSQGKQIINLHNYLPNFVMHLELYWEGGVRVKQSLPLTAIVESSPPQALYNSSCTVSFLQMTCKGHLV